MEKVQQLRCFGETGDWSSKDDDLAAEQVEFLKAFSVYIKEECSKHGLKYFENSTNHWKMIDTVVTYLSE